MAAVCIGEVDRVAGSVGVISHASAVRGSSILHGMRYKRLRCAAHGRSKPRLIRHRLAVAAEKPDVRTVSRKAHSVNRGRLECWESAFGDIHEITGSDLANPGVKSPAAIR